jgi:hypothetical protein
MVTRRNKPAMRQRLKRRLSAPAKFSEKIDATDGTSQTGAESRHLDVVQQVTSLFEPDVLSRAQYLDALRPKTLIDPEKKLMFAVLEDAIHCFQDNFLVESGNRKKLFEEAKAWFFQEGYDWIFSFRNVSELLGVDPEYLRGGLMRWRERQLAREVGRRFLEEIKMAG